MLSMLHAVVAAAAAPPCAPLPPLPVHAVPTAAAALLCAGWRALAHRVPLPLLQVEQPWRQEQGVLRQGEQAREGQKDVGQGGRW